MASVAGCRRVPEPPARMMPFLESGEWLVGSGEEVMGGWFFMQAGKELAGTVDKFEGNMVLGREIQHDCQLKLGFD